MRIVSNIKKIAYALIHDKPNLKLKHIAEHIGVSKDFRKDISTKEFSFKIAYLNVETQAHIAHILINKYSSSNISADKSIVDEIKIFLEDF